MYRSFSSSRFSESLLLSFPKEVPISSSLSIHWLAFFSFVSDDGERKKGRLQEREKKKRKRKRNKNRYFESTSAGMSSPPREREREMAIRLYLLRVFEQFSRTEDPLASNPYRESRLRGEERKREGERKSRRSGGRRRRRPVTKS